jgi:hypothetical protein
MVKPGGSANINGILYQLLRTLGEAVEIRLNNCGVEGDELEKALLIVEPVDGGDLQLRLAKTKRVEQIKAKSGGGTWSLKSVVENVLPDLYRGVCDSCDGDVEFVFTTEGRIGNWKETLAFFQSVELSSTNGVSERRHKMGNRRLTDDELIEQICKCVSSVAEFKNEARQTTRRKVLFMLSRFSMPNPLRLESLITSINNFLIAHVDIDEEVDGKRRELCSIVLELAANGDQTVTAAQLLQKANLPLSTFRNEKSVVKRLSSRLARRTAQDFYEKDLDVRFAKSISKPITILSSDSGYGKTWSLAGIAHSQARNEKSVAWVSAHRGNDAIAAEAANELWKQGLDRDRPLTLDRIARRRNRVLGLGHPQGNWAVVCVDDVSLAGAQQLVRLDWQDWGIALVMATSNEVADQIRISEAINRVDVVEFSLPELKDYMSKRDKDWALLSDPIREFIRRPILAKLFCDIGHENDANYRPENEFELMELFWAQISNPIDLAVLRDLASTVFEGDAHPIPAEFQLKRGIEDSVLGRLKKLGWLRNFNDGHFGFWHTRLLSFALAKSLALRFESGTIDIEELCELVQRCDYDSRNTRKIRFGYTPFDLLWLLRKSACRNIDEQGHWKILAALERYNGFGHEDKRLYETSIPYLGASIVPVLFERIKNIESDVENGLADRVFSALAKIVDVHNDELRDFVLKLLSSKEDSKLKLGLMLSAKFPLASDIDAIWDICCANSLVKNEKSADFQKDRLISRALEEICKLNINWLDAKLSTESNEHLPQLVYALAEIESEEAGHVWEKQKSRIMNVIAKSDYRCLVNAIHNFRDTGELSTLVDYCSCEEEWVALHSCAVLACMNPEMAINAVQKLDSNRLWFGGGSIAQSFAAGLAPEFVNKQLHVARRPDSDSFANILQGIGDRLDSASVRWALDWLNDVLKRELTKKERRRELHIPLGLVAKLKGQVALETFRAMRGTELETQLLDFADSRVEQLGMWHDWEFESVKLILMKIAGNRIAELANRMLESSSQQAKRMACKLSLIRSNRKTAKLLESLALSDERWMGETGSPTFLQNRAVEALAANAFNAELIRVILSLGGRISDQVGHLKFSHPAMTDDEIQPAVDILRGQDKSKYANAILAIGQSGRTDFVEAIQEQFLASELDSEIAEYCMLALEDLSDQSAPIFDRLVEQYRTGHFKHAVLKVLDRSKDATPFSYLKLLPKKSFDRLDQNVLRYVAKQEETKDLVHDLVRENIIDTEDLNFFTGNKPEELMDPRDEDDRNRLWEHATVGDGGFFNGDQTTAIEKLAEVDKENAYRLAVDILKSDKRFRTRMPPLLLKINSKEATEFLINFSADCLEQKMLREIGLALREHAEGTLVKQCFATALVNANRKQRRSLGSLCGYLKSEWVSAELRTLAFGDRCLLVSKMAQSSIRMHQKEESARKIIERINIEHQNEIWGAIESVVHLVDPALLAMPEDSFDFLALFRQLPHCFSMYANELIKSRLKKLESNLDSVTRRWKD